MDEDHVRILLVEDDKIDRQALDRFVKKENLPYDLTAAASESEALTQLENQTFDVILLDYNLGVSTGLELLPHTGETPVIFVTGSGSEGIAVEAMRQGAYDYLIKDPGANYLKVLPSTINHVLERRRMHEEKDRLIEELKQALAEVKALRGFLPICANCKKIRDDDGYWQQIEKYIQSHSEAIFTHSICPDCRAKLYPGFTKQKEE